MSEMSRIGALTETAPTTDTASSGLNGRMQRVAQRLTSAIALLPASIGQKAKAASLAVTLASDEDLLKLQSDAYETVAASQTDQILGATGAVGDYLAGVLIVPAVVAAGAVSIKDGNGSAITIFVGGGTTALVDAKPFFVPVGAKCAAATTPGWKITTGANVSAVGVGKFT